MKFVCIYYDEYNSEVGLRAKPLKGQECIEIKKKKKKKQTLSYRFLSFHVLEWP